MYTREYRQHTKQELECRVYNIFNLLNLPLVPKRITVQLKAVNYTFEGLNNCGFT